MKQNQTYLIGILAGIAAGLMVVAAFRAGVSAFFLVFAAPTAVYIASMGWGSVAGLISATFATAIVWYVGGTHAAVFAATLLLLPAAWIGHLTNLGQMQETNNNEPSSQMVWYPISGILFQLMIFLGVGFVIFGILTGYSVETIASEISRLLSEVGKNNPELPTLSDKELLLQGKLYAQLLPLILPTLWLMFHAFAALISAKITQKSGKLARVNEDVAANVYLPIHALGLLAAGLIGAALFSGTLNLMGSLLLGLSIGGFGLVGLAELHHRSRDWPSRGVWLWLAYLSIIVLSFPILVFGAMGISRSLKFIKNQSYNNSNNH